MEFINTGLDERILKSLDVEHPSEELVKAMNKQGLVQKEVTVQGKNGTFTRKQWVKASESVKTDSSSSKTGGPVDISKFSFTNYRNPDGQNRNGYKTYRDSLQSVANETEKAATRVLSTYGGSMKPYDQLRIEFSNINGHSSYRDMISNSSEQGLKDAKSAILARQRELLESVKDYTKWDSSQRKWVKDSEAKDAGTSQSIMTQEEFNKKYPNGGMQDPVECLSHNGSNATWHGEKLQNPSVMKRAKEEYAQFKKDKAALLEAGKSESSKASVKKDSKSNKPSLSDIQGYGYDPATATGDPTYLQIGNKGYFKIGNNKWQYSPSQGSALGGTYTDAQISDMVSKTSDEVKVMPSAKKNSKSEQQPESKKDTTDKGILDSKLNPHGYKVGDYLKVKHGRSYTTYQVKSLEKSKDISGKEHVYLNCIEIMKNGQVYDFNHIITADSELISYKIDEPLTLKDPSGKRSKDNFQQTSASQKPPAKGYIMEIRTGDSTYRYVYAEKPTKASAIEAYEKAGEKLKSPVIEVIKRSDKTSIDSKSVKDLCVNITKDGEYGLPKAVNVKLSPADAKKKTQEVTKGVSDKKSFMEKAKAQGITWKENDHEGINWMRCCMAMNKYFENGGSFDEK